MKNEITELKVTIAYLEEDIKEKIKKLSEKDEIIAESKFYIDRFKHNQVHFKFYAGFDSYGQFKCVLEYLQPAASMLSYWENGRKSKIEKIESSGKKAGRTRSLNPEEELFLTLTRLRCGFPTMDLAIRFNNMSTGNIIRILVIWFDFLHSQFRMLPIWASKKYVEGSMPKEFKDAYPATRVILDCTELFIEMPTSARAQSSTFSNYKHHNTAKRLVGIAPNGMVTFVSDLYTGRNLTEKSLQTVEYMIFWKVAIQSWQTGDLI